MLNMPRKVVQEYSTPMMFCTLPTVPPAAQAPNYETSFWSWLGCANMRTLMSFAQRQVIMLEGSRTCIAMQGRKPETAQCDGTRRV